jgi:hypothetical protein
VSSSLLGKGEDVRPSQDDLLPFLQELAGDPVCGSGKGVRTVMATTSAGAS